MPQIKSGMIVIWSGAIVAIPGGYVLCDGNNGTPDLRNRFIMGAGDTYNPGDNGGTTNHTHDFTTDGHFHILPAGSAIAAGANFSSTAAINQDGGITDPATHTPPYYALAFIMKL